MSTEKRKRRWSWPDWLEIRKLLMLSHPAWRGVVGLALVLVGRSEEKDGRTGMSQFVPVPFHYSTTYCIPHMKISIAPRERRETPRSQGEVNRIKSNVGGKFDINLRSNPNNTSSSKALTVLICYHGRP
jgi:hypothetical protein